MCWWVSHLGRGGTRVQRKAKERQLIPFKICQCLKEESMSKKWRQCTYHKYTISTVCSQNIFSGVLRTSQNISIPDTCCISGCGRPSWGLVSPCNTHVYRKHWHCFMSTPFAPCQLLVATCFTMALSFYMVRRDCDNIRLFVSTHLCTWYVYALIPNEHIKMDCTRTCYHCSHPAIKLVHIIWYVFFLKWLCLISRNSWSCISVSALLFTVWYSLRCKKTGFHMILETGFSTSFSLYGSPYHSIWIANGTV